MAEQSTVARPYAKAAFEYARDHQALDAWSQAWQWRDQSSSIAKLLAC